jgi:uncharacterized repeat protein (TIGR01451 family)
VDEKKDSMAEHEVLGTSGEGRSRRRVPGAGIRRFLLVLAAAALLLTGFGGGEAGAATAPGTSQIRGTNVFYAYVEAGETLSSHFVKTNPADDATDATITIERPGAASVTCTLVAGAPAGTACSSGLLTAPTTGVWRITFAPEGASADRIDWTIHVRDGGMVIPGRVYTESYKMVQFSTQPDDVDLWYQSELGYLYAGTYGGYQGIDSLFRFDSTGVRQGSSCESAYRSINVTGPHVDPDYSTAALGECGDPYKIFFERPDEEMPETAARWDGDTDWLNPPVVTPAITSLAFVPDGGTVQSGELTFDLSGFSGQLAVQIDANGDGDYDDPEDVTIPRFADGGAESVVFDGLDGLGNPIPHTQAINARVVIDRTAELHFTNGDVESRAGGIEVEVLNGPTAGDQTLYWDDTAFTGQNAGRCSTTPILDGTSGVDSAGGVHAWTNAGCPDAGSPNDGIGGSWGDVRVMDDWTFVPVEASAELAIAARELDPADLAVEKTGPVTVAPQGEITWTITVTNVGTTPSTGHTIIDEIPSGVTDVASPDEGCTVNSIHVQCGSSPLEPGESVSYTIIGTAPTEAGTIVDNRVEVVGFEEDVNPDNDVDDHQTEVVDNGIPLVASVPAGLLGLALAAGGVLLLHRRRGTSISVAS